MFTRPAPIDLATARSYSFSLDLDLDDEEAMLRDRRSNGGDNQARSMAQGRPVASSSKEAQPFLIDSDDEDQ